MNAQVAAEPSAARRRSVPSQCYGCGRFIGISDPHAWATAYHSECDPKNRAGASR